MSSTPVRARAAALLLPLVLLLTMLPQHSTQASHTAVPTSVTAAGSFQKEAGCSDDWLPDCATTHLTYDAVDDVWQGSFNLPAGSYAMKAVINNSWGENYGAGAAPGGGDITFNVAQNGPVKFYYDHKSHWITNNALSTIATVAGSFQKELGCPDDWQPDCLRSWMQDPDGNGVLTFETTALPIGNYEFKVALNEGWASSFPGSNVPFSVTKLNQPVFFSFNTTTREVIVSVTGAPRGNITRQRAYWVSRDTIAWNAPTEAGTTVALHYDTAGNLALAPEGVTGGMSIPLTLDPAGLSEAVKAKFPHLAGLNLKAFKLPEASLAQVPQLLKGQLAVSAKDAAGTLLDATGLQLPGVLDELYTYTGPLGATFGADGAPTLRLWAPTAQRVRLHRFADATTMMTATAELALDPATGVWSIQGDPSWRGQYYLYEVTVFAPRADDVVANLVTDPYSISLSRNSARSQIVDLNDPALKPPGWDALQKPDLAAPEDIVLYELHVRDFSVSDQSVPEAQRGTFAAFALPNTDGMRHLSSLAQAGLTHVHLLPPFDCASIDEDKSTWSGPTFAELGALPPDSPQQQALILASRDDDGFNWCYDPYHYTVPEGSYSTDPSGTARILEFRQMVQGLSRAGLRTVMDVVYNHTAQAGQDSKSVLDKIVPGYYHRLNAEGSIETSTCCQNTATEHAMMEKLMVDSLVTWATEYKVDGFRFDLMGHHSRANMVKVRDTLAALTPARNGVDGSDIYLYGEGWNFGEVANDARFVQATQLNMAGTGIGTFNDRIRDAVRGGGPFDSGQDMKKQGFATGLVTDPNALGQGTPDEQRGRLLLFQDQIRVALAGNLRDYSFTNRNGEVVTGKDVDYNGSPTGYTADPQEVINYVEAHDNMTLFDGVQLKAPDGASVAERRRMTQLATDVVLLSQGVPFIHAGQELLRSKSFTRDSYNAGDWFNRVDWTYQTNNFGGGLPMEQESSWPIFQPLLANPALKPAPSEIVASYNHFTEMLRIRKSTPLFRLRTAAAIQQQVRFLNSGAEQQAGLIVMQISDTATSGRRDSPFRRVVVVFNADDAAQTFTSAGLVDARLQLHPFQQGSADPVVRTSSFDRTTGALTVPGRTTAVFVEGHMYRLYLPIGTR